MRMLAVGTIVLECVTKGESEMKYRDEFPMNEMRDKKLTLDIGHTHVSPIALRLGWVHHVHTIRNLI